MKTVAPPTLWAPSAERAAGSALAGYMTWLGESRGLSFDSYQDLWRWSVDELEEFWQSLTEYFGVRWHLTPQQVLIDRRMPGAEWFPGGTLNWAEHALLGEGESTVVVYRSESGERAEWSFDELRDQTARVRAGLARLGVAENDGQGRFTLRSRLSVERRPWPTNSYSL